MQIFRLPTVKATMGQKSDESVYSAIRAGLFTSPVKIGPRSVGWPDTEVHAINAARVAGKTDAEIKALVNRLHAKREQLAAELV